MTADATLYSPEWWLEQLYRKLVGRLPYIERCERYYDGDVELQIVSEKYKKAFGQMLRGVSDNWMQLVVDAKVQRLHVDGFRVGENPKADVGARRIWQRNHLDADSELVHRAAIATGVAYAMVWPGKDGAEITGEHPAETIVAYESGSSRRRAAALKAWRDEWTGKLFANVYLPDAIWKFETSSDVGSVEASAKIQMTWKARSGDPKVENPYGWVPIVEFRNQPRLRARAGRAWASEIAHVIPTQDQVNKLVCDMLVASEFAAFRQRWAVGVPLEEDENGNPVEPFKIAVDRLLTSESEDTKFGEFAATDLSNYVKPIENRVQSIASRTSTPPHYLLGSSGTFPAGESLRATETGLVSNVKDKQRPLGESWEELMRMAGVIDEIPDLAAAEGSETIWKDPEYRTEAEHIDSLVKKLALGVPKQQLWEDAGYTPEQIARFPSMLLEEALNRLLAGEPVAAPVPAGV